MFIGPVQKLNDTYSLTLISSDGSATHLNYPDRPVARRARKDLSAVGGFPVSSFRLLVAIGEALKRAHAPKPEE